MAAGPLSFVALIAGWITTEVGRQPWIVYKVMRTTQAVTAADGLEVGYAVPRGRLRQRSARRVVWLLRRLRRAARDGGRPRLMLPELCLGLVMLGVTAYAVLGSADFGAGFWDLTAGGAERGGRVRGHDPALDEPGVGGQPRVADLRARDRLDRVPGRLRLDLLDAARSRSSWPRSGSSSAAPRSRCGARRRRSARRACLGGAVRAVLGADPVLPRRRGRRHRLRARAGRQRGGRPCSARG